MLKSLSDFNQNITNIKNETNALNQDLDAFRIWKNQIDKNNLVKLFKCIFGLYLIAAYREATVVTATTSRNMKKLFLAFQLQLDNQKRNLQHHGHGNKERIDNLVARVHGNEQRIRDGIALLGSQAMKNISSLSSTITDVSAKVTSLSNSTNSVSSRLSSLSSEAGLQNDLKWLIIAIF